MSTAAGRLLHALPAVDDDFDAATGYMRQRADSKSRINARDGAALPDRQSFF